MGGFLLSAVGPQHIWASKISEFLQSKTRAKPQIKLTSLGKMELSVYLGDNDVLY